MNSLGRLHSLTKNLIRSNKLGEYDKIIQEQRNESIIEKLGETKTSFFFFSSIITIYNWKQKINQKHTTVPQYQCYVMLGGN